MKTAEPSTVYERCCASPKFMLSQCSAIASSDVSQLNVASGKCRNKVYVERRSLLVVVFPSLSQHETELHSRTRRYNRKSINDVCRSKTQIYLVARGLSVV